MRNLFLLTFLLAIIYSCDSGNKVIDLLEDPGRWTGDEELVSGEDGVYITGEFKRFYYKPGIFSTFENFELVAEIKTDSGAAGAIIFHTSSRNPDKGYEVRIDNSQAGSWSRLMKTGSLSSIRNINYNMVPNGTWFELKIRVIENQIEIFINNLPLVNYIESEKPFRTAALEKRMLGSGTFAIQTLYDHSGMNIRSLSVVRLPGRETKKNEDPEFVKQITLLNIMNIPVADYHVHIKGDLTMDQVLEKSSSLGINYGIAANCGLKFPIQTNEELESYLNSIEGLPIFKAMQAEGREWVDMFSPELIARFDYAFTDAMTWTNKNGTRMRLWIPEETEIGDPEDFMEQLVSQIELIVKEPISIYVNPTYLPEALADRYEELWTDDRIERVIRALKENNVALEINSRLELPGSRFIKLAKENEIKFAMGTNNTSAESLGRLDWALKMVHDFNLQSGDMFLPDAKN